MNLKSFDYRLRRWRATRLIARGDRLREAGNAAAALESYERALQLAPGPVALYKRGNALLMTGRPAEAVDSYTSALDLKNDYADAIYNRGLARLQLRQLTGALADFDAAMQLKPDDAQALNNRGNVLLDLKQPEAALASYDRALAIDPHYVDALHNRSIATLALKRPADAAASLARLIALAPDYPYAKSKLLHAKMLACDWSEYDQLRAGVIADVRAGKSAAEPFALMAVADTAADLAICAGRYASDLYPPSRAPIWHGERYSHDKIRIGYVAGEFREQATGFLMAELFERHDKSRFEIHAYDSGWDDGSVLRRRMEKGFTRMTPIAALPDADAAQRIHDDEIDILVNLNGYFGAARQGVFALRPAPVQVNYLGFPGTLGAPYMDYIIADRTVIPENDRGHYVESVVYLPDSYQVNDSNRSISPSTPSRAEAGLPETGFVFCCFNNNYKITPPVFAVWLRLLAKISGSVMWLYQDNQAARENLQRAAAAQGIEPQRLVFAGNKPLADHLARHRLADLFLDTTPCNAHTTASDALWAGLPVLTCTSATFPGRVAASLLYALDLPELVTANLADYETLAADLATDRARIAQIRARLERNRDTHPLFDCVRFTSHLEAAYTEMWHRSQRDAAPASFSVTRASAIEQ